MLDDHGPGRDDALHASGLMPGRASATAWPPRRAARLVRADSNHAGCDALEATHETVHLGMREDLDVVEEGFQQAQCPACR